MKILALDSSGLVASVAVVEDDGVNSSLLAEYTVNYKKTHSQTLLPMLDEIARMIELDLNTIDAIAVAAGPGSFTGLRIGSATAKGLGLALDKPLVHVPTVDALAYNLYGTDRVICPLMDARRNQVYTGIYEFRNNELSVIEPQMAVGIEVIAGKLRALGREVVFLGDGVPVFRKALMEELMQGMDFSFAPAHLNKQRAGAVAALAVSYVRAGKIETAAEHRPDYLRPSQAERERAEKEAREKAEKAKAEKAERVEKGKAEEQKERPMEERDLPEVSRIEGEVFSVPWSEQSFRDSLALSYAVFLTAECEGRVAGYCGCYQSLEEAEITNVAVKQEFRGRGIAKALLQELFRVGEARGASVFLLEVRAGNQAAIRLYEGQGFQNMGLRRNFYEKPREDAVIMQKCLKD